MAVTFSPDELASVGYTPSTNAHSNFTPEQLASVGYKQPQAGPGLQGGGASVGDTLEAGGAGFLGRASDLVGSGIHNLGTAVGGVAPQTGQAIQNFAQPTLDYGKQLTAAAQQTSPTAAALGSGAATGLYAGATGALGSGVGGVAAGSALMGLDASTGKTATDVLSDTATSAVVGAAAATGINVGLKIISGGLKLAGKGISAITPDIVKTAMDNVSKGSSVIGSNADTYAQNALEQTLKLSGGDLSKATPENIVDSISKYQASLKDASNGLYTIRDAAAQAANVMVGKDTLGALKTAIEADASTGVTSGTPEALNAIKRLQGTTGAPVSFAKAQQLLSGLGDDITGAMQKGDLTVAKSLLTVKDAFSQDINAAAAAHPDVQAAHDAAQAFYKNSYAPIASLDMQRQIANKVTQSTFVANLAKNIGKSKDATTGFMALPDDIKQQVLGAATQAIKDSATVRGNINLTKFSNSLDKSMTTNPVLYKATDSLANMKTLADVLDAVPMARLGDSKLTNSLAIAAGFGSLANPGFMAVPAGRYMYNLYSAGKMINNEAAQNLLTSMRSVENYPQSSMYTLTRNKITTLYANQTKNLGKAAAILEEEGSAEASKHIGSKTAESR